MQQNNKEIWQLIETSILLLEVDSEVYLKAHDARLKAVEERLGIKYDPNQPRVPAASPDGGQWTSGGSSGGGSSDSLPKKPRGYTQEDLNTQGIDAIEEIPLESLTIGLVPAGRALSGPKWVLGQHKSPTTWSNQMINRGWTPRKISETIAKGEKFEAPNKVNPGNTATRYQHNGKFVVKDDTTGEILQIGGENDFIPNKLF